MTTQEILKQCKVEGTVVKLPDMQLEREAYVEVKKAIELIGGKWKGGKVFGFVFEEDPTELLADISNGETRNLKKEFQFFATPPELAERIVRKATPFLDGQSTILEPSAGDGALIKAFRKMSGYPYVIDCYEAMDINRTKLAKLDGVVLLGDDFLLCERKDYYDHIFANPPFTKNQDIDHIRKMYEVLRPGGTMVSLSSRSWQNGSQKKQVEFQEWLISIGATIVEIDPGVFKESGTMVASLMITIEKAEAVVIEKPAQYIEDERATGLPEDFRAPGNAKLKKQAAKFVENMNKKEQKCRICGCTEDNCAVCIRQLGHPCHWVEDDLCSACVPRKPQEILKDLQKTEVEIQKGLNELQSLLNPTDMNFFKLLAEAGNTDMTIRIMQKNNKLTLNIMPGSINSNTKPMLFTGTGDELDEAFFTTIKPAVDEVAGIITNINEVKEEVIKQKEVDDRKPAAKSSAKKSASRKKTAAKKEPKPEEKQENPEEVKQDLFS